MKTKIILISGKMGSGKTTIAKELAQQLQIQFEKTFCNQLIFANTIYQIHDSIRDIIKSKGIKIPDAVKVKDGPLLQYLGTEWGRKTIYENVWVDCAKGEVSNVVKGYNRKSDEDASVVCIFADCRFENELDCFPDALKIRLECDRETRMKRVSMWRDNDTHPSEIGLDKYLAEGKFHLRCDTDRFGVDACVANIISEYEHHFKDNK